MRHLSKYLVPAVAASLLLAACGSSSKPASNTASGSGGTSPSASASLVKTASNSTLGATVLVDDHGLTLYHLSAEHAGKWICTSAACLGAWHPLTASAGAPSGSVGSLGTIKRPDGTMQVTFKGLPLYTFAQDKPGDANGQGIKDVGTWTAATTKASASTSAGSSSSSSSPAPAASGGGGYGY
jgi:predicted lipoprotein with Yx(FWY)xxD motif